VTDSEHAPPRRPISSGAVWRAGDVGPPASWTSVLDLEARAAIVDSVTRLRARGASIESLARGDLDGAALHALVQKWNRELQQGRGFVLIRRFPVDELDPADIELAYFALGLELGHPVSQDALGTRLGHVRDAGVPRTTPAIRRYATNERQDFHTDGADIIGLLCLQRARRGGESRIASAGAVYNEILRRDPSALDVLYAPMCWDRNDEQGPGEAPFYELPVLRDVDGRPRFFYIGWYIRDAQRHDAVPRLTREQLAAMDLIEDIANDPAFHVEMDFQPGDIQLLNNSVILHAREAYEDHPEPSRRRHLLRLWLAGYDVAVVEDTLRGGIPIRGA
jgi:Taurine catabolism dioxygenase TauD, TfdA family